MSGHLRLLDATAVVVFVVLAVVAAWALVLLGPDMVSISPALLTALLPALGTMSAATVLRNPLGDLDSCAARSGQPQTWLLFGVLTAGMGLGLVAAGAQVGLAGPVLRSCLGYAALATIGAVLAGPNGAAGLALTWLMGTVLISVQSDGPAGWMWNLDVTGPATTASTLLTIAVAAATVTNAAARRGRRAILL